MKVVTANPKASSKPTSPPLPIRFAIGPMNQEVFIPILQLAILVCCVHKKGKEKMLRKQLTKCSTCPSETQGKEPSNTQRQHPPICIIIWHIIVEAVLPKNQVLSRHDTKVHGEPVSQEEKKVFKHGREGICTGRGKSGVNDADNEGNERTGYGLAIRRESVKSVGKDIDVAKGRH